LHQCAEKELRLFLAAESDQPSKEFEKFYTKLAGLTSARTLMNDSAGAECSRFEPVITKYNDQFTI
ncbi:hypothetical protein LINPERPRIM_LOCUS3167, partial [Linum perenne]